MPDVRCPDWSTAEIIGPDYVMGCGSLNTVGPDDEGLHDCLDCGIWFHPETPPPGYSPPEKLLVETPIGGESDSRAYAWSSLSSPDVPVYRMGDELIPASRMKEWHNSRGLPWGTTFDGPEPVTIARMARSVMSNISVHLANEHGIDPDSVAWEERMMLHLAAHLYARFRKGQGHYHEEPPQ